MTKKATKESDETTRARVKKEMGSRARPSPPAKGKRSWPLRESLRVSGERTNCFCFLFGDVQGSLRIAPAMEGTDFRPSKTNGTPSFTRA